MIDKELRDILLDILRALKENNKKLELLYNLFAKYDSLAIQELEDLRSEETKK